MVKVGMLSTDKNDSSSESDINNDDIDSQIIILQNKKKRNELKSQLQQLHIEQERIKQEIENKRIELDKCSTNNNQSRENYIVRIQPEQNIQHVVSRNNNLNREDKNRHNPKSPADMVNQNTRFIYEQQKGMIFKRFCIINKERNAIFECDENDKVIGNKIYRSLNEFCKMVKVCLNAKTLKQNPYAVLQYYDIKLKKYMPFTDLEVPNKLN